MEEKLKEEEKTYAQLWRDTVPTEFPTKPDQVTQYIYGTRSLTKITEFVMQNNVDNKIIDELMALNPMEEGEDRKLTAQFQKALLKHRARIYKYPKFSTKQLKRKQRNANTTNQKPA